MFESARKKREEQDAAMMARFNKREEAERRLLDEINRKLTIMTSEELGSLAIESAAEAERYRGTHDPLTREITTMDYSRASALGRLAILAKLREPEEA